MVRREEGAFGAEDGRRVFFRSWLPGHHARATVIIVHGYAEHSGRYDWTGERLAEAGFAAYALDLVGHGRSEGPRAFVRSMDEFLGDVRAFVALARSREPDRQVFVLGHSMGGGIVTLFLAVDQPDVHGAILSGPVLATNGEKPPLRERIIHLVARFFPSLPTATLNSAHISRDQDVVRAYDADPLVYRGRMKAGLISAMMRGVRHADKAAARIAAPLLILHGRDDKLTSPAGSERLHGRVASADRTLIVYEGLHHEILNEPERDRVIADVIAWLERRI